MDKREIEIGAIAASVAAGCVSCYEYHMREGISTGLSEKDIHSIFDLAIKIRKNAYKINHSNLSALNQEEIFEDVQTSSESSDSKEKCC